MYYMLLFVQVLLVILEAFVSNAIGNPWSIRFGCNILIPVAWVDFSGNTPSLKALQSNSLPL